MGIVDSGLHIFFIVRVQQRVATEKRRKSMAIVGFIRPTGQNGAKRHILAGLSGRHHTLCFVNLNRNRKIGIFRGKI